MDNEMFDAQCKAVAACINGLRETLLEAGGGGASAISKVVADVHELIQSFRVLGKHYVFELLKKCRELETKDQEVKELSRKLEQGENHTKNVQKGPDPTPAVEVQRHVETTTIPGVCVKNVEELSMNDLGQLPGIHAETFQVWDMKKYKLEIQAITPTYGCTSRSASYLLFSIREFVMTLNRGSEELGKSLKGLAPLDGDLDEYREEMFEVQEKVGKMAVSNDFLSRDVDQAPHATREIRLGERSKGINGSTKGCNEQNVDFLHSYNELGPIEQSCSKRRREIIDLSDSEETKKGSDSTSGPTRRKQNRREDLDCRLSHKSKQGSVQERVAQEQNMVETICKAMENYQHENFLGPSTY